MLNLIIAEDEIFTAEQIANAIDWAAFDIKMSGIFRNGKDALDYIVRNNTDIVITDIKMPFIDGLSLIENCKTISPHTKFIVISGYRDFEYARQSIHLGVVEYLLKPIQYSTLVNALTKVKNLFSSINVDDLPFQDTSLSNSRQTLFTNILCGLTTSLSDISTDLSSVGIPKQSLENPCMIIGIKFHDFDDFISNKWKHSITRFKDSVTKIIPLETNEFHFVIVNFLFDELFIFVTAKNNTVSFKNCVNSYMESIKANFFRFFSLDIEYSIISEFDNISDVFSNVKQQTDCTNIDIIDKCKKYVSDNLREQITLLDVANYVYLNPVYLSSYFKNKTGINFSTYVMNTRVERAKHLLTHTQSSISQICELTGFKSESHFYRTFKNTFGVTPQQYKEQLLKK